MKSLKINALLLTNLINSACRQTGSYPETGFEEVGRISNDKPAYQY